MDKLPVEILCKILSYLKTKDLYQFCKAYGSDCFFKEKSIIRSVDFTQHFEPQDVPLREFITMHFNCAYIKSLNIDHIYWLTCHQLRTLIRQLKNLDDLHAIGTKLSFMSDDIKEYVKLKKLAVSVRLRSVNYTISEESKELKALKSLCVCIIETHHWDRYFMEFLKNIPLLKELWISYEDTSFESIGYDGLFGMLENLEKLVVKSKIPVQCENFEQYGFSKTFECKRSGPAMELIFEKIPSKPESLKKVAIGPKKNEVEKSLEMFEIFLHDLPYGPKESKQIYINESIENIYFEDLNFCQPVILCNSKYINAAIQILSSKNSSKLKRLRFRSCLFRTPQTEAAGETIGGKRSWQGNHAMPTNPFWAISDNLKELVELEIEACPECNDESVIRAYCAIKKFENLCRLSIEVPSLMDGSFLREVFIKCQHLEYLNLACVVDNADFIKNLYNNLKYADNLRDFRLEHKYIDLDELLAALNSISNKKLLRVFLNCDDLFRATCMCEKERMPVYRFVQNNPHLVVLVIDECHHNFYFEEDQKSLSDLTKKCDDARVYCIKSRWDNLDAYSAHCDIFYNLSNTAAINVDNF